MDPEQRRRYAQMMVKTIAVLIVLTIVGFGLLVGICGLMFR